MSKISAIVAVTRNWGIGKGDELLVRSPSDMAFFSGYTQGKAVLVGHNTAVTLPRDLVGRQVVVDLRGATFQLRYLSHGQPLNEVVVIGGAKTYEKYASQVEQLFITRFDEEGVDADCFFPYHAYQHLGNRVALFKGSNFIVERWS